MRTAISPKQWQSLERLRVTFTANGKRQTWILYHLTKFFLNLCFTVHYFYPKISSFTLVFSITLVLDCFSCTFSILRNNQLESDVCHKCHSKSLYWQMFRRQSGRGIRNVQQSGACIRAKAVLNPYPCSVKGVWAQVRTKQLLMAATAKVKWLCTGFWAREHEQHSQTLVFTKTAGLKTYPGSLLHCQIPVHTRCRWWTGPYELFSRSRYIPSRLLFTPI